MILNKSSDLIDKKDNVIFCKFRTEAVKMKELKLKWTEKMASLQEKGFTEKDMINLKLENKKLKDLEFLRNQIPPGPFTKPEDETNLWKIFLNQKTRITECSLKFNSRKIHHQL